MFYVLSKRGSMQFEEETSFCYCSFGVFVANGNVRWYSTNYLQHTIEHVSILKRLNITLTLRISDLVLWQEPWQNQFYKYHWFC